MIDNVEILYYCSECGHSSKKEVTVDNAAGAVKGNTCEECGAEFEVKK